MLRPTAVRAQWTLGTAAAEALAIPAAPRTELWNHQRMFPRRTFLCATLVLLMAVVSAESAAAAVYFGGALAGRHVRPRALSLSADGTLEVSNIRWTSWGGRTATGRGEAEYHGCTPYCGTAPVHHAPVRISLSNLRSCSGRSYYTHVQLTLPSGRLLDPAFLRISWKPC